jgi:hypothetical protein
MEVAWSKVRAIQRMLEDFPFEISQRLRASPYCQQDKWDAAMKLLNLKRHFYDIFEAISTKNLSCP